MNENYIKLLRAKQQVNWLSVWLYQYQHNERIESMIAEGNNNQTIKVQVD